MEDTLTDEFNAALPEAFDSNYNAFRPNGYYRVQLQFLREVQKESQ